MEFMFVCKYPTAEAVHLILYPLHQNTMSIAIQIRFVSVDTQHFGNVLSIHIKRDKRSKSTERLVQHCRKHEQYG